MANDDDVAILGAANMRERQRTLKNGTTKSKFTVEIKGDSIVADLNPDALVAPVAVAIATLLKERIQMIAVVASPYTRKARRVAEFALSRGEAWATKRYSGGKMGTRIPNRSDRLFNDSGALVEGLTATANKTDGGFTINVPARRLNPETLNGGVGALERIWTRLVELVPELGNPNKLMDSIPVRSAVKKSIADSIQIAKDSAAKRADDVRRQFRQARVALGAQIRSVLAG